VVELACAKDPAARYQHARQMAADLRAGRVSAAFQTSSVSPPTVIASPSPETLVSSAPGTQYSAQGFVMPQPPGPPLPASVPLAPAPSTRAFPWKAAAVAALVLLVLGGGALALVLALSSSRVSVPDLDGMSWEQARRKLEKSGLSAERREVTSSRYDPDTVIDQNPAAGEKVKKGTVVLLDVVVEAETEPDEGGKEDTASYTKQMDGMIAELVGLEEQIRNTASEISSKLSASSRDFSSTLSRCSGMLDSLGNLRSRALSMNTPQQFSSITPQFVQLVDYCVARVNALIDGVNTFLAGGDYVAAFNQGVSPKNSYNALFPSFQQQYNALSSR